MQTPIASFFIHLDFYKELRSIFPKRHIIELLSIILMHTNTHLTFRFF